MYMLNRFGWIIPHGALGFDVLPLNDDPQYCWFEMNVTNIDTQQSDIYGYGRDKGFEKHQQYPMYTYRAIQN